MQINKIYLFNLKHFFDIILSNYILVLLKKECMPQLALVSLVSCVLRSLVPHVPLVPHALVSLVPCAVRALVSHVPRAPRALLSPSPLLPLFRRLPLLKQLLSTFRLNRCKIVMKEIIFLINSQALRLQLYYKTVFIGNFQ